MRANRLRVLTNAKNHDKLFLFQPLPGNHAVDRFMASKPSTDVWFF
jgi:hypothetical protein